MKKIDISQIDLKIARKINRFKAMENCMVPVSIKDKKVIVLARNEDIAYDKTELEFLYNRGIEFINTDENYIKNLIAKVFLGEEENLIDKIMEEAICSYASDIHFEPQKNDILIRIRVDGILISYCKITDIEYLRLLSRIKILANMDITEKRRPQDGKSTITVKEKNYDLRISTIPITYGEKLVVRILYGEIFSHDLKSLNMTNNQREKLRKIIALKNGLVLINGPTGSGKSTTLYSILKEINKSEVNITTIEDPVEVLIKGINQVSLNRKANITFANGLRSILRQDPDILMIGEIRDEETASLVVTASLTGHKVYSTIHTKTPREVYYRLEDMGVKQYLIKDSIVGIVSQRLIRVLCSECKEVNKEVLLKNKKIKTYKEKGCSLCNYTGYKGRTAISSVVYIDEKIRKLISNIFQEIIELSNYEMINNLDDLIIRGDITYFDYNNFLLEEGLNYEENKIII